MSAPAHLDYTRRPSVPAFMLRALYPSPGWRGQLPGLIGRWRGHRIDRRQLARFLALTGLDAADGLPILYPQVFGFPLIMATLTHPIYPLPIWNALQIRNRMTRHRRLDPGDAFDIETRLADHRVLDKGIEIDLHTTWRSGDELAWEGRDTFYYRGRFGAPETAAPDARAPDVAAPPRHQWRTARDGGWPFARFTGDYNGIHLWTWYARLFGFRRAFHHPHAVTSQCLARLPRSTDDRPERLETWLKGPVPYGAEVRLAIADETEGHAFALTIGQGERPAIVGRWSAAE